MWSGIILFIIGLIFFLWQDFKVDLNNTINSTKFGQFGDFIGGIIGSMWALSGVILFYVALTDQRKDMVTNTKVLKTQVEALNHQRKEFELQRKELEETREIFKQQHKTQVNQRFENTFFQLLRNHNEIVNSLDVRKVKSGDVTNTGRDCFKSFYRHFEEALSTEKIGKDVILNSYIETYNTFEADLSHYFRNLYNIIKFIDQSGVDNKKTYTNFVRAQLSNYELDFLFYNCLTKNGKEKFKPLVESYSLLKNINKSHIIGGSQLVNLYSSKAFE
ncbi:MAG: hypothetical protein HWE07_09090 [Cytophagia bacterium]|nr:hypothetical protein [Cytophagia bacterium]